MSSEKILNNVESKAPSLNWEDLLYLNRQKLCLRTTANRENAEREQTEGFTGDAISLATFGYPGSACANNIYSFLQQKDWVPKGDIKNNYSFAISWLSSQYSDSIMQNFPEAKTELVQRVNEGIVEHIKKAFIFNEKPAFLLLSHPTADLVYDLNSYALGKLGKQRFSAEQVKKIVVEEDGFQWDAEKASTAIIKKIKELVSQPTPDLSYQPIFTLPSEIVTSKNVEKEQNPNIAPNTNRWFGCSLF